MDYQIEGYDISGGQLYDENGNPVDAEEVAGHYMEHAAAAGLDPADVGQLLLSRGLMGRPAAPARGRTAPSSILANLLRGNNLRNVIRNTGLRMAPTVQAASPGPVDETPLPVDSGATVAAGAAIIIQTTSQIIFKPRRLIIPESIAPFFVVNRFDVGNVPLFAAAGDVPAEAFRPDSINPNIKKVTAQPGVQILIGVQNIDGVGHRFRAAIFGEGSQPGGRC